MFCTLSGSISCFRRFLQNFQHFSSEQKNGKGLKGLKGLKGRKGLEGLKGGSNLGLLIHLKQQRQVWSAMNLALPKLLADSNSSASGFAAISPDASLQALTLKISQHGLSKSLL